MAFLSPCGQLSVYKYIIKNLDYSGIIIMITPRQVKIQNVISGRQEGIIVMEDIHDPHNTSAVLRSCDGFGFQKAYLIFEAEKRFNPKRVGKTSSSSANKWITSQSFATTKECFDKLRADGYAIYATTLSPVNPVNLYSSLPNLGPKIAIVFGNENRGVSKYATDNADYHLYIPMRGFVQSFNISVCAALVIGEITRQREVNGMEKYLLDDSQKSDLQNNWK